MGSEIWLDPTLAEAQASDGTLILSCMPALGTVTSVWQSGKMPPQTAIDVRLTFTRFD
jgi:exosome complex component MTR3